MPKIRHYSRLRAATSIALLALWCLIMPLYLIIMRQIQPGSGDKIIMRFHRVCCRILGLKLQQQGSISAHNPTLFVCNHISYADILVLGGIMPGFFIAKSDIAHWPILGRLARLQNTLFFERSVKQAKTQTAIMRNELKAGNNLILFPEGTSTCGREVMPFKSSLFAAVEIEAPVMIQPLTISYRTCAGKPMEDEIRDCFAWYDEMAFVPHFIRLAGMAAAGIEVSFHAPVNIDNFASRKDCALYCQQQVSQGLHSASRVAPDENAPSSDVARAS